ncbi:hypothetical protein [Deinococcus sedimenti]|uniref:ATP-binding protein n=1 Tax=Deinococcus sedimenti TaxID=1867090 RepID=A0ABQ2S7P0_9DEIO|nr:hypothetical protein [Deinococcus sedimenti]GGS05744.1 hypothetical protein GCM10008960_35310 [Deinococcus sedimenti]
MESDQMSAAIKENGGEWVWRPAPSDGGRDFGNSNIFATPPDIDTLVRETGQNSLDAAMEDAATVSIRYVITELSKSSKEYAEFEKSIGLSDLMQHVESAAKIDSKMGRRLKQGLEHVRSASSLTLLRIDDYGTTGLFGSERQSGDGRSPFAAFIRNNLDSSKSDSTAGGSFGLGKAVNWVCSDLSAVMVASAIRPTYPSPSPAVDGADLFRVIGKAELTWHEADGKPGGLAGPGWFSTGGDEASSLWLTSQELKAMQLDRTDLPQDADAHFAYGTSLLVVGFTDPQASEPVKAETMVEQLVSAAAKHFWPAIVAGRLSVSVERWKDEKRLEQRTVSPNVLFPEFYDAYDRYLKGELVEQLRDPGDTVKVDVPLVVPALKGQRGETIATCHLLIRLAEPSEKPGKASKQGLVEHVALTRGRAMVVKYWKQSGLVVGGRLFHAVLLAGTATGKHPEAQAAERFLRDAEPPAHDEWRFTSDLSANYVRGAKSRLDDFHKAIVTAIRKTIRPPEGNENSGPSELMKLLAVVVKTPVAPGPKKGTSLPATMKRPKAFVLDERWQVSAIVTVKDRTKRWRVTPRLFLEVESGRPIPLRWEKLDVVGEGASTAEGALEVAPNRKEIAFAGVSAVDADGIVAATSRLKVDLKVEEMRDADQ